MSIHLYRIGLTAGATALAVAVLVGCGRSESDDQSKAEPSATVIPASSQADAQQGKAEPKKSPESTARDIKGEENPATDGPRLKLEKDGHDFGKIYDTSPVVYKLRITNVGNKPLTIQRISTSCGCTSTNKKDIEGKAIAAGESRLIDVKYKPKATAAKVTKTVTIQSDDFIAPVQRFKISAQLVEPARLDPLRYQMGQIRSGEGHKTSFLVLSPDSQLEVFSVESDDEYFEFTIVDEMSDNPDFPGRKRIDVEVSPKIPSGPVKVSFKVRTKAAAETGADRVEQELNGMILGHVRGELTNNPRFLRVRNSGAGESFEVKTMLYSENARQFKITGTRIVDSTLEDITVETIALEPFENDQPGYWVVVHGVLPEDAKGAFQGKVLVETDIPSESEKAVIFNGIVRRKVNRQQ